MAGGTHISGLLEPKLDLLESPFSSFNLLVESVMGTEMWCFCDATITSLETAVISEK
jgi:hypothetical protein